MGLDLLLFTADPARAAAAVPAGLAGIVVDWERRGKARRQEGEDTQINEHTAADLARVRAATTGRVVCRLDAVGPHTAGQVDDAVRLGADEVLLPMVRRPEEVDAALDAAAGRCGVGVMVETQDAVECVRAIARRPLRRVYVGLNDLRIDRGSTSLFEPLVDGTVDAVRAAVDVPLGVAGLTRVGGGAPVPSRLLAGELVRLGASFTFLRRSFIADVPTARMADEVPRMHAQLAQLAQRSAAEEVDDQLALAAAVGTGVRAPQVA
ncbi:MAG TPA: aldolase/citrate lyase family protein [Mycobacteriales bacterium]|nr:aldolase/citrate lyase family protein [Mycobacteriales bacterium]